MKKRLLALLLAGAMSVGLAACGNSGDNATPASTNEAPPTPRPAGRPPR